MNLRAIGCRTALFVLFVCIGLRGVTFAQVTEQWVARNDSVTSRAVVVDKQGNVYVAGNVLRGAAFNIALVKYNSSGVHQWLKEFNGTGNDLDDPTAIAVDTSGNVFVAGYSFRGPGAQDFEIITIKYNPNGDTLWARRYNGLVSRDDRAFALVVDAAGNAYVAGHINGFSVSGGSGRDYITLKYSPNGSLLWAKQLGLDNCTDTKALVVDQNGNVHVTGSGGYSTSTSTEYITVKYNSIGDSSWVKRYDGAVNESDEARGIALDDSGNVYVTGRTTGSASYDCATIKYGPGGQQLWVKRFNGPADADDTPTGIVVDRNRNAYVVGKTTAAGSFILTDFIAIKYNSAGDSLWIKRYNGPGNSDDTPVSVAIDTSGSIYIAGRSTTVSGSFDYVTLKYRSNGDSVWLKRYNGAVDRDDEPSALTLDRNGNVYVTGYSNASFTVTEMVTIKYSQPSTDVQPPDGTLPESYALFQNYPNPFNPTTRIGYRIQRAGLVSLKVFDVLGREVTTLVNEEKPAGTYEIRFDASGLVSGMYFYRLEAGAFREVKKFVLLR